MTEKISREEKKQAKSQEAQQKKEAKAAAQAEAQFAYLKEDFKRVKAALTRTQDPYSHMAMEGQLKSLEMTIRELAHERGGDPDAIMQELGGFSADEVKALGMHRLEELNKERLLHEIRVKMGDPASREKFYEFEHKARRIVETYGLDDSHLEPFIAPEIPPEVEAKLAGVPEEDIAALKKDMQAAGAPEKKGFFRKLFGGASKEEKRKEKERAEHDRVVEVVERQKQRYVDMVRYIDEAKRNNNAALVEQLSSVLERIEREAAETINTYTGEISNEVLGPLATLRGATPRAEEATQESGFQRFKHKVSKYFKIGLFAAAAFKPLPTADLSPLPRGSEKKIEVNADATASGQAVEKGDDQVFAKTYAKMETERAPKEQSQPAPDTTKTEALDTLATPRVSADTEASAPVLPSRDSIEKLDLAPQAIMKTDTAAIQAKFMEGIRAIDQAEKTKPDVKNTYTGQEAPVYAPLPTAPVSPGDSPDKPTEVFEAPYAVGITSAPAYQVLRENRFEESKPSAEGIKVSYQDEKGASLNMDSLEKKLPRIVKKSIKAKDSIAANQEVSPAQSKAVTQKVFESFKKNLLERDFTNPNSYKKALQTIITMYQLDKIAGSWYMEPKIIAPNQPLTDRIMNVPQTYFETKGGSGMGMQNFMPVLTTTINYAEQNQEHFGQVVMGMFHEYIHAWQRSSAGITDHVEREAQAHYFTLFPKQFSEWRRANYQPKDASGNPSGEKYPEIIASFPELDRQHVIMYAAEFEKYYAQLSLEKQDRYKAMHEKVLSLIDTVGRESYDQYLANRRIAGRAEIIVPLETDGPHLFAESSQPQNVYVAPIEVSSVRPVAVAKPKAKTLEQVPVSNIAPTKARIKEQSVPLEPVVPVLMPTSGEKSPKARKVPAMPVTPPEFPKDAVPMQPGEEYSPVKFDFKDVPPAR